MTLQEVELEMAPATGCRSAPNQQGIHYALTGTTASLVIGALCLARKRERLFRRVSLARLG